MTLPLGLDALFRGLAHVLQTAHHIAEHAPADPSGAVAVGEERSTGVPGVARALYGVSVRIGPRVVPPRRHPVTLRKQARTAATVDDAREPAVDVFDEGDHYLAIADLPGVREEEIEWSLRDGRTVTIRAESADRHYGRDVRVDEPIDPDKVLASYANGVLELRLWKQFLR